LKSMPTVTTDPNHPKKPGKRKKNWMLHWEVHSFYEQKKRQEKKCQPNNENQHTNLYPCTDPGSDYQKLNQKLG